MKLRTSTLCTLHIMKSRVNIYNSSGIPVTTVSYRQSFTLSSWWMWIEVKWGMAINITDLRLSWGLVLIWDVTLCSLLPSCQHSEWTFFTTFILFTSTSSNCVRIMLQNSVCLAAVITVKYYWLPLGCRTFSTVLFADKCTAWLGAASSLQYIPLLCRISGYEEIFSDIWKCSEFW